MTLPEVAVVHPGEQEARCAGEGNADLPHVGLGAEASNHRGDGGGELRHLAVGVGRLLKVHQERPEQAEGERGQGQADGDCGQGGQRHTHLTLPHTGWEGGTLPLKIILGQILLDKYILGRESHQRPLYHGDGDR